MFPMLPNSGNESCILVGGPLDGYEDMIATIGPDAPCDVKIYPGHNRCIKYKIGVCGNTTKYYEKDNKSRWVLYYTNE